MRSFFEKAPKSCKYQLVLTGKEYREKVRMSATDFRKNWKGIIQVHRSSVHTDFDDRKVTLHFRRKRDAIMFSLSYL